jgi:hypothetical protein
LPGILMVCTPTRFIVIFVRVMNMLRYSSMPRTPSVDDILEAGPAHYKARKTPARSAEMAQS